MKKVIGLGILVLLFGALGCGGGGEEHAEGEAHGEAEAAAPEMMEIVAEMSGKSGVALSGQVTFMGQEDGTILVSISVQDAPPGVHAVHIHETGDCSADDGTSAGGHWNPTDALHGEWGGDSFHFGDLGNMEVDEFGNGALALTSELWSIGSGGANDLMGKAVIVHAGADDFETQPTGAAGGRIGCAVLQ